MAAKCAKKKRPRPNSDAFNDNAPHSFQFFISAVGSKQVPKLPIMKSLYHLLVCFSLGEPISWLDCKAASNYFNMKFNGNDVKVNFKDICFLSNLLFRQLDIKFKDFFDALCCVSSSKADDHSTLYLQFRAPVEELTVMLRCCMVILTLLMSDQELVLEKGQALLSMLSRLISVELSGGKEKNSFIFRKLVSHEYMCVDDACATSVAEDFVASISFMEPSNPFCTFLCVVLEAFADELLVNKSVRDCLLRIDSLSSEAEKLFTCHFGHGDIGSVLEVISAHFILSFSDEPAFAKFINRLVWQHNNDFSPPQMSLTAALSLLLNPVLFSAPKMFQAHFILLVSDAISTSSKDELRLMNCYLSAFERSVILYTRHMSNFYKEGHPIGGDDTFSKSHMSESNSRVAFECYLLPTTWEKIHHLVTKCNDSWGSYSSKISVEEKSELLAASIVYIKHCLRVFNMSFAAELLSILSCIILRSSSDDVDHTVLYTEGETSAQDLCLLASMLKLMTCSMWQVLWCLKHRSSSSSKAYQDVSSYKEYDAMMHVVHCFQKFSVLLPVQRFLCDTMESHPTRHSKSKWMLLHFSGLLSLCYVSKLDFLVKGCLFALITVLNLFILEEGGLDALGSLSGSTSKSSSGFSDKARASTSSNKVGEVPADQKSSQAVALKFQKIRTLYLGTGSRTSSDQVEQTETPENASVLEHMDSVVGIHEETCNGESFLKCVISEGSLGHSDMDDLANFIECKQGKDYSGWLKDRQMFRQWWKSEKIATYRWKKKKKAWKSIAATKT